MSRILHTLTTSRFARLGMRFAGVGTIGFIVDTVLTLALAHGTGLGNNLSRIIAMAVGVLVTYVLNRRFTFHSHDRHLMQEGGRYALVNITGSAINLAGFHLTLLIAGAQGFAVHELTAQSAAIVIGSFCAFLFNYPGSYFFAFNK